MLRAQLKSAVSPSYDSVFQAALELAADGVVGADALGCVIYMNPAAEKLSGWHAQQAIGRPVGEVLELAPGALEAALHFDALTGLWHKSVLTRRGAMPLRVEFSIAVVDEPSARPAGYAIVFRDGSPMEAAQQALRSSEAATQANAEMLFEERERSLVTLNSIGDSVITVNFRGRVNYLNVIAEQMTGRRQADAVGQPLDDIFVLLDQKTREPVQCPATQAIIDDQRIALENECVLVRRDGEEIPVEASAAPIHDSQGCVIGAVMVAHDVTAARDASQRLSLIALYDTLTKLPNRALFGDRLARALGRARRNGCKAALLFIDLDRFKPVNDQLGHDVGDQLLQAVAARLVQCVRSSDTVSRYGGDEFVILIPDVTQAESAANCARKVLAAFDSAFVIGEHRLSISASIGIASYPDMTTNPDELIKCADTAMYAAKQMGASRYAWYSTSG